MSGETVSILEGNTFVVSDERGDIEASLTDPTGLFAWDTRFLSRWVLTVDGDQLASLSVDELQYFQARFFLVAGTGTVYVDSQLSVIRTRAVGDGFHEQVSLINHSEKPMDVVVRIEAGADFADLFEVKDALEKQGQYTVETGKDRLVLGYQREQFRRETTITADQPAEIDEHGLAFTVHLEPKHEWTVELDVATTGSVGTRITRSKYGERAAPRTWTG